MSASVPAISTIPLDKDYVLGGCTLHVDSKTKIGTLTGNFDTVTVWFDANNNLKAKQSGATFMIPQARMVKGFGVISTPCLEAILIALVLIAAIEEVAAGLLEACLATGPFYFACAMAVAAIAVLLTSYVVQWWSTHVTLLSK